jgi:hypothetical protein
MGSIDKYCPCCGSTKVYKIQVHFDPIGCGTTVTFKAENYWYECGDCHSEWQAHRHSTEHMQYGSA